MPGRPGGECQKTRPTDRLAAKVRNYGVVDSAKTRGAGRRRRPTRANMADAREGAASGLQTDGYEYFPAHARWSTAVRGAAKHVEAELVKTREASGKLEAINSSRLQLKFPRTIDALPPALRALVELLEAQVVASAGLDEALVLQDCYALFTPADEESEEARAPQRWHLDAIKKFPVAALCLNGGRWTEFADGPYSDFSAGVPEPTLERWSAPWRSMSVATWESESAEEWEHWSRHLHAARLVTADEECDWDLLPVAPTPPRSHVGDASIFWSNKVGPRSRSPPRRLLLTAAGTFPYIGAPRPGHLP